MTGPAFSRQIGDWAPYAVLPVLALVALPMMSFSAWVTLTLAGLAMGMLLFLMASGLTLIFGLMDVLNFAHGAFITLGAYIAVTVLVPLAGWTGAESWLLNLAAVAVAIVVAMIVGAIAGVLFERVIVGRVYGAHLRQVLITVGALIVAEQLFVVLWGPNALPLPKPVMLRGSIPLGAAQVETYRVLCLGLGLAVAVAMQLVLTRTRIGLLVRAGVENREMVEALGYRIRRLFIAIFATGTALAALGGVMWAQYQEVVTSRIGSDLTILVFIVLIIGGLGSVGGCFVGAILVGLVANYTGFLLPKLALGSNIMLMVLVLMWRPRGLFPVAKW
jgi:branched-chain amino acid transport system permease protein